MTAANITDAQKTEVLKIVVGLFSAAPGSNYLNDFTTAITHGMTTLQLAEILAMQTDFFDTIMPSCHEISKEQQAELLMKNFDLNTGNPDLLSADAQAEAYFRGQIDAGIGLGEIVYDAVQYLSTLPAPEFRDTAALLTNKALVAEQYSLNYSSDDLTELRSILGAVSTTYPTDVTEAQEYLLTDYSHSEFSHLIYGQDTVAGFAGDDTFTAGLVSDSKGNLVNSLESGDILDGSNGKDTLNATLHEATTITPMMTGIEIVNIRNVTSDAIIDFARTTGVEQIWNNASSSDRTLTYETAPIAAIFGVRNTSSTTDIKTFDDATSNADHLSLAVADAGSIKTNAVITSTDNASATETLSIAATGKNFVDVSAFNAITKLIVTNTGTVAAVVDASALTELDASNNCGGVQCDLNKAKTNLTIAGGLGNDVIFSGDANDSIHLGAGNDRVVFAAGTINTNDIVDGGEGKDIFAIAGDDIGLLNGAVHTGFEVLELTAAKNAVSFDNTGSIVEKIILSGSVTDGGDLNIDNLGDGILEIQSNQNKNDINVSGINISLLINANTAITVNGLSVTNDAAVTISTATEADDIRFSAIETDGVATLTFSGAGDVIITDMTDVNSTNNATARMTELNLINQTGGFEISVNNIGYGTQFLLANLGNTTTAKFDFDGDKVTDDASYLDAAAGSRDTFVFTTAFDGNIAITNGEFGSNATDDQIDLTAFNLTGISDLNFNLENTGLLISSKTDAFDGHILLVGISKSEIDAADFVF
ncbi:hypothetical protein C8R34_1033 [Nitrosomonas sp. Nm84]|uniref:hypothetical protein n=1 Tax=Nitrosomonas sp. Nm84 TaxID=200124 RepID=UPI000D755954|nr:hypothetical protein [Nitrosomonas sp. Nm84]PXW89846.1 hypothetical protein C8R34_1033 [Nitrosomonas sp. Nm84]